MVLANSPIQKTPTITWETLPADFLLPDDPVDNIQQPAIAAALTDALGAVGYILPSMLITTNMALVATVNQKIVMKAPDWFFVPKVYPVPEDIIRRSYTPYSDGEPVAVAMEFLSDTDGGELSLRSIPPFGKFYFYEQILKVPTYIIYDPYGGSLEVRYLQEGKYILQSPNNQGRFWIPEMELYLGIWSGERLGLNINWLRWWDKSGNLLLWSSEQTDLERQKVELERDRADQERDRAEKLAAKLRELGIDPHL
jgi:Uma2 family endonuclease